MRDTARDVGEGDSMIVVVAVVVGVTVNIDNVVGVGVGVSVSAIATAGGLPDESRARAPPSAGTCRATLGASSHDA